VRCRGQRPRADSGTIGDLITDVGLVFDGWGTSTSSECPSGGLGDAD
jgi:hypothetical protein